MNKILNQNQSIVSTANQSTCQAIHSTLLPRNSVTQTNL